VSISRTPITRFGSLIMVTVLSPVSTVSTLPTSPPSISFGVRNVEDPSAALREMKRVVKSGGRVAVLEFGRPSGLWGSLFRLYSKTLMPFIGGIISGNQEAYSYLDESAAEFPSGDAFVKLMEEVGFVKLTVRPLMAGVAWIYVGVVE